VGFYLLGIFESPNQPQFDLSRSTTLFAFLILCIIVGHIVGQLGAYLSWTEEKLYTWYLFKRMQSRRKKKGRKTDIAHFRYIMPRYIRVNSAKHFPKKNFALTQFRFWLADQTIISIPKNSIPNEFNGLRSIAMTLSEEGTFLSRKFKFIELLCRGSATSLAILSGVIIYQLYVPFKNGDPMSLKLFWLLMFNLISIVLLWGRAKRFSKRAACVPFDCVVADILNKKIPQK